MDPAARTLTRLGAATGLLACAAVGISVLVSGAAGGPGVSPAWLWWTAYLVYLAAFALSDEELSRGVRLNAPYLLLAVQLVAGAVAWMVSASVGWTSILLVVSAASAAYLLGPRGTALVVAAQSVLIALGLALDGQAAGYVVLGTAAYTTFQGFAALVVWSQRLEADARAELAVAHAELRATSALLEASTRDAERLRISRELHDVVGHQLTALTLELEVAAHRASPPASEHVDRARGIARDLLADVRSVVGRLRDPDRELEPTLRALLDGFPHLDVALSVDERVPLDAERTLAVVRCVQEVLTNTVRHAGARTLRVSVTSDAGGAAVDARDDGGGVAQVVPGHGLTGMRERFERLGGYVRFDSTPGGGFRVAARAPAPGGTP